MKKQKSNTQFETVQVHRKVIAEIAYSAVSEVQGLSLDQRGFVHKLRAFFGQEDFAGIRVNLDSKGDVSLKMNALVKYGVNIPGVVQKAQNAVKSAIENTMDIELKNINININIQGIERGAR